jgi:(E)-4-hydroxy-3-methylbut-2-enyl-diphosphate synthase
VFIDGEKRLTLRGDGIATEFHQIVENYIENRFGAGTPATTSTA